MQALKNIVINGAVSLVLLFGLTLSATAAELTFEEVKASAEDGYALAQTILGNRYANGEDVRQDYSKAFYWYEKSANQGDSYGQVGLGNAYLNGRGVRQDHKKALYWYEKSAKQNNVFAQSYVALMYEYGDGVSQNKTTAKEWHGKACDNGYQGGCDSYKKLNEQGY